MNFKNKFIKLFYKIKQWHSSLLLLPIMLYYIFNQGKFTFIDYVNLLIHEGGHGIFSLFGKFIYTLGGTLAQIIIPGMFVIYYWRAGKKFLTQLFLLWLGENLINISIYAADARSQKLPLLGGSRVYHDWTYILNELSLLHYDKAVGLLFYWLGVGMFVISFFIPFFMKKDTQRKVEIRL